MLSGAARRFALRAADARAAAAAPVGPRQSPRCSALAIPLRALDSVPVLPAAVPVARSGDPPFPKIVRTASGEVWLAAAGDVRSAHRGKAVAPDGSEFACAVLRPELSTHWD